MNAYEALGGDPISRVDPFGTDFKSPIKSGPPAVLAGERDHHNPNGRFDHVQWGPDVPAGVVHYTFDWGVSDCATGQDMNSSPGRPGSTAPNETAGHSEHWLVNESTDSRAILNGAMGRTGSGYVNQDDGGVGFGAFLQANDWKGRRGWMTVTVEVYEGTAETEPRPYSGSQLNNVNVVYDPGGILDLKPVKGDKKPDALGRLLTRYTATVTWDTMCASGYSYDWSETQFDQNGGATKKSGNGAGSLSPINVPDR
jgi:hypothetical protein